MPRKNPAPMKLICATNRVKAIAIYDCRGRVLLNVELVVADGPPTTTYYEYSPSGTSTSFNAGKAGLKTTVTYFSYDPSQSAVRHRGYDSAGRLLVWNSICSPAGTLREHQFPRLGKTVTVVDSGGRMTIRHYLAAPRKAPKTKRSRKKKAVRSRRRISRK